MQRKNGISLIVLVITIIVMVILAAAIVISLNNSGIIQRAGSAMEIQNLSTVREMADLYWSEGYMNGLRGQSELETYVLVKLEEAGVDLDKYIITVTTRGTSVELNSNYTPGNNTDTGYIVPTGAIYISLSDMKAYYTTEPNPDMIQYIDSLLENEGVEYSQLQSGGSTVKEVPSNDDIYIEGDFVYVYDNNGWEAVPIDASDADYTTVKESINGENIGSVTEYVTYVVTHTGLPSGYSTNNINETLEKGSMVTANALTVSGYILDSIILTGDQVTQIPAGDYNLDKIDIILLVNTEVEFVYVTGTAQTTTSEVQTAVPQVTPTNNTSTGTTMVLPAKTTTQSETIYNASTRVAEESGIQVDDEYNFEIESTQTGPVTLTFDVSGKASVGDKATLMHYTNGIWEQFETKTVDSSLKVTWVLESYSPYTIKITHASNWEKLNLNETTLNLKYLQGSTVTSELVAIPNGITGTVNWTNSNSNVVTLNTTTGNKVTVTVAGIGTANITASVGGQTKTCAITVSNIGAGDYIEYNVGYTDVYKTTNIYTSTNGWRLVKATSNGNGTYRDVIIMSTGIPAMLYYKYDDTSTNKSWWVTNSTTLTTFRNILTSTGGDGTYNFSTSTPYYSLQAAAGLYYNFKDIKFQYATASRGNNLGYFKSITSGNLAYNSTTNSTVERTGGQLFNLFGSSNATVRLLTLPEVNVAVGNTDIDKYGANTIGTTQDTIGLYRLDHLSSVPGMNGFTAYSSTGYYWLASPYPGNYYYLTNVFYRGYVDSGSSYYGVRPAVCLTSNVQFVDTNNNGVPEIVVVE